MSASSTVELACSVYEPSAQAEHITSRAVVVLLHPFPFDARMWHQVALRLAMYGWKVLVPNMRGCGASPAGDQDPALSLLAADVWQCLDVHKVVKPIVIGISLGGYVSMEMLRQRPDGVSGIGLVDTKATTDSEEARDSRLLVARTMRDTGDVEAFAASMLPRLVSAEHAQSSSEVAALVTQWMNQAHPLTIAWLQEAMADRPNSVHTLEKFSGPALLLRGSDDEVCSAQDYEVMKSALPHATYREIAGTGHLPPIEDGLHTTDIIHEWLSGTI